MAQIFCTHTVCIGNWTSWPENPCYHTEEWYYEFNISDFSCIQRVCPCAWCKVRNFFTLWTSGRENGNFIGLWFCSIVSRFCSEGYCSRLGHCTFDTSLRGCFQQIWEPSHIFLQSRPICNDGLSFAASWPRELKVTEIADLQSEKGDEGNIILLLDLIAAGYYQVVIKRRDTHIQWL